MSTFSHNNTSWQFQRYPKTENRSLRAWSAADELLLHNFDEFMSARETEAEKFDTGPEVGIYHDRFGFLATVLQSRKPSVLYIYSSQDKSMRQNLQLNELEIDASRWVTPLESFSEKPDIILMKIPKSLDRFRLYLHHAHQQLSDAEESVVFCGFMTRHFSPQMLEAASEYFELVEQTRARKKARLIVLRKPRKEVAAEGSSLDSLIKELNWSPAATGLKGDGVPESITLKQYFGVFASSGVDPATQMLLEQLRPEEGEQTMLDLGCGNGIIARALQLQKPDADIHAIDDDFLAVASARMNTEGSVTVHHYDGLDMFPNEMFDLVVTNPPSHLGHENNIEVTINLFKQASKKIKSGGRILVVATRHLNYSNHLKKYFVDVKQLAATDKYEVLESRSA